jgi:prepilin-type N-terminal cleavage/methylation domain-containing protein
MRKHAAFTLIELIFVIVIMAIVGKFGVEFLIQVYNSYIFEKVNHNLQTNSAMAVELIAKKLQYRIKDSVIARTAIGNTPVPISDASGTGYTVLEWIGYDNEGFRGVTSPYWSGIIDLDNSNANILLSPDTNTSKINSLILSLSNNNSSLSNAAIYFIGSNSDVKRDFGWIADAANTTWMQNQNGSMHPIKAVAGTDNQFQSSTATNFANIDLYEYYQLAWTAYGIVMENYDNNTHMGTLRLYWDYQPWEGETIANATHNAIIMENVSTFQFISIGAIMKIQVCTKSNLLEEYSLCKEKTVF